MVIEKWADQEQLSKYSEGTALAELNLELKGLLAGPADLAFLVPHPAGDPAKGSL